MSHLRNLFRHPATSQQYSVIASNVQQYHPGPTVSGSESKSVMRWGAPIWTGFHVMSVKIRPEFFSLVKEDLINIIINICTLLPCPDCSNHAMVYIRSYNLNQMIRTKEDFIEFLYSFHSMVSKKKGKPFFPREEVVPTYSGKNLLHSIQEMVEAFADTHGNTRQLTNNMKRSGIIEGLKVWFKSNLEKFEP